MKHFFSLGLSLLLALVITAQTNSNLTISTTGNSNLRIILAGKR